MELKKRRTIKRPRELQTIFVTYLAVFIIAVLLLAVILSLLFTALMASGEILPANHASLQLPEAKEKIAASETVTPDMIPETCSYAVFSKQGEFLYGNMSQSETDMAWKQIQVDGILKGNIFYLQIPRDNDICIVRYTIMAQFRSPALRAILPLPEYLFFILFGVGFLLEVFLLSRLFSKRLSSEMKGLQDSMERIEKQDLDFPVESSGVLEIQNIINSINKMKEALKASLKKQWDMEQNRREQMSSLAHDIKTPLTIVRGNVDLLSETNQTEEQKEYTRYIGESTLQMEEYLKALIEISRAEAGFELDRKVTDSNDFTKSLYNCSLALTAVKEQNLSFETLNMPESFYADSELLKRAILNLVSNAAEYTPESGFISMKTVGTCKSISFCVVDSGKGFSESDLKEADRQFYMGDKSRSAKGHYGMGLYIAQTIATQHGGTLTLSNSELTGGGKATITISNA